jgi:hypothetical protein
MAERNAVLAPGSRQAIAGSIAAVLIPEPVITSRPMPT